MVAVVVAHKPSGVALYHLNLVDVGLCVGIPYHCGILNDGSDQGHVCLFFDGWRAGADVSPEESTGVVGFLSGSVDVFVPAKFGGDLNAEVFASLRDHEWLVVEVIGGLDGVFSSFVGDMDDLTFGWIE